MKRKVLSLPGMLSWAIWACSTAASAENLESCIDLTRLHETADYDFEFDWVQRKTYGVGSFEINDTVRKALVEINNILEQLGPTLVLAVIPPRIAGSPSQSQKLREAAAGWEDGYAKMIESFRQAGIRAADLSEIYDGQDPTSIQRSLDHHLTGYGAWRAGAAIAAEINSAGQIRDEHAIAADRDVMFSKLSGFSRIETTVYPSQWLMDLLKEECSYQDFIRKGFTFVSPTLSEDVSNEALFGEAPTADALLIGTSFSTEPGGALGRAIETFHPGGINNRAINGGWMNTALAIVTAEYTDELKSASWLVWEIDQQSGSLPQSELLGSLMLVKGARLGSCSSDAALLNTGQLTLGSDGRALLPIPGVLEDVLTITVPFTKVDELNVYFHLTDGSTQNATIYRNFTFMDGSLGEAKDYHLGLLGVDWFGNDNPVRSIEIEYTSTDSSPSSIGYQTCWTMQ